MAIRELCYYDRIITFMNSAQEYNMLKYLSAPCISIHMLLCCEGRTQLSFPTEHYVILFADNFVCYFSLCNCGIRKDLDLLFSMFKYISDCNAAS